MTRDEFLKRVRRAAVAGQAYRVHAKPTDAEVGYVGADGDLCRRLAEEIQAVGGQAVVVDRHEEARAAVAELLRRHSARSALCWRDETLDRLGLDELLDRIGVERLDHPRLRELDRESRQPRAFAADVGITGVDCAVAETGSLMLCSGAGRERISSLLPPVHVAVVEQHQIVPDLFDAIELLEARKGPELPTNVVFVTGPSKTGDIELQLTTGVHGPGHWHVIVIRERADVE